MKQVKSVRHLGGHKLQLTFSDGSVRSVDLSDRIKRLSVHPESVFKNLLDIEYFRQVEVDHELGTITWPNDADFCPDVLYDISQDETQNLKFA